MNHRHYPKVKPQDVGFSPGDYHIIVDDMTQMAKCFDYTGKRIWMKDCMAKGVAGPRTDVKYGDTPYGLYKLGLLYTYNSAIEPESVLVSYGRLCYSLEDIEGNATRERRTGLCLHSGGGKALPNPFSPYQSLVYTLGCLRMHNADVEEYVYPLTHRVSGYRRDNTVYVSVIQDDK